jgi:DNA-binding MarR family transcriptional regulator
VSVQLQITVGAASKVVDRVEAAGHCARQPDPRDRRSSLLVLTPAGAAAAGTMFEVGLLDGLLSPTALTRFAGTLSKVRAAL